MTRLADMQFDDLQTGMKFSHAEHGEQIIVNLGRNRLGPVIQFHDCSVYDGRPPDLGEDENANIFEAIAQNTFPRGTESWDYAGMIKPDEVASHDWQWLEVPCAHCGYVHRQLAPGEPLEHLRCRKCGWHPSTP